MSNPEENVIVDAPVAEEVVVEEVVAEEVNDGVELSNPEVEQPTDAPVEEVETVEETVPLSDESLAPAEDLSLDNVITQEDLDAHPELADAGVEVGTVGKVIKFMGKNVVSAKVVVINNKNYVQVTLDDTTTYNSPIDSVSKDLLELAQNS